MPEEVGIILSNLKSINSLKFGDLELYTGKFVLDDSRELLITTAWSGWGKVSAARATTRLLSSNYNSMPVDFYWCSRSSRFKIKKMGCNSGRFYNST